MEVFATIRWMFYWLFIVKLKKKTSTDYTIIVIGIFFYWTMYIGNIIYIIKYLTKDFANALLAVFVTCALTTGTNSFIVGTVFRDRFNGLLVKFEEIYAESMLILSLKVFFFCW